MIFHGIFAIGIWTPNNLPLVTLDILAVLFPSAKLVLFRFLVRKYVTKFCPDNGILDRAELLNYR